MVTILWLQSPWQRDEVQQRCREPSETTYFVYRRGAIQLLRPSSVTFFFYSICFSSFDQPWTSRQDPCYSRPRRRSRSRFSRCMPAPYSNEDKDFSATFPFLRGSRCSCQRSPLSSLHPPMIARVYLPGPSKEWFPPFLKWYTPDLFIERWGQNWEVLWNSRNMNFKSKMYLDLGGCLDKFHCLKYHKVSGFLLFQLLLVFGFWTFYRKYGFFASRYAWEF